MCIRKVIQVLLLLKRVSCYFLITIRLISTLNLYLAIWGSQDAESGIVVSRRKI